MSIKVYTVSSFILYWGFLTLQADGTNVNILSARVYYDFNFQFLKIKITKPSPSSSNQKAHFKDLKVRFFLI